MHQRSTHQEELSSPAWETLHTWLREQAQGLIQKVLEAEVAELLGRARYQRRAEVDGAPGYRNGYGKPRKLTTPLGTVTLRGPGCHRQDKAASTWRQACPSASGASHPARETA